MVSSIRYRMTAPWTLAFALCCGVSSLPVRPRNESVRPRNESHAPAGARERIAVLISGVQQSLLLTSKLSQIVPTSRAQGYEVDFYIKLVAHPNGIKYRHRQYRNRTVEPLLRNVTRQPRKYASALTEAIRGAGAELKYFELTAKEEEIELPGREMQGRRLWQYDPFVSPVGQNLLRRWKSIQELARVAMGQFNYSFVIVTRDDDHFLGKLNVSRFTSFPHYGVRAFFKNCKMFGGVNDKTIVFGAAAANRTLPHLYTDAWMADPRLDRPNAESFLAAFIKVNGAFLTAVSLGDIPSADSLWVERGEGHLALCQKATYLCYDPEDWPPPGVDFWQRLDKPDPCRDMEVTTNQEGAGQTAPARRPSPR